MTEAAIAIVSILSTAAVAILVPFISARLERSRMREQGRDALRYTSYGSLWEEMAPLAIYGSASPISRTTMGEMSKKLSTWYFSANGGLMLTIHTTDLYFALQNLVNEVANTEFDWEAKRTPNPFARFIEVLQQSRRTDVLASLAHINEVEPERWPGNDLDAKAVKWRQDIEELGRRWAEFDSTAQFAVLQQVASVLRTCLTLDVRSRLS